MKLIRVNCKDESFSELRERALKLLKGYKFQPTDDLALNHIVQAVWNGEAIDYKTFDNYFKAVKAGKVDLGLSEFVSFN